MKSATTSAHYPKEDFPIIVFAGRSNVGKSSLINHLFNSKNLARISTVPGKTALINYFLIDNNLFLVDLPGYGFAKKSKQEQLLWSNWINEFIDFNMNRIIFTILIDSRHPPFPKDIELIEFLNSKTKKPIIVYTKTDKIKGFKEKKIHQLPTSLERHKTILYSIKDDKGKKELIYQLKEILENELY